MKHTKWNYVLVKEYVENLGYELISEKYINNKTKLLLIDKQGYYYEVSLANLLKNNISYKFSPSNSYTTQNIKLWLKLNNKPFILISDEYINNGSKLIIKDFDGYYYKITFGNMSSGQTPDKFHISNPYTIQNIKLWCELNNKPFKLLSDEYKGNNKKLKWQCLKDGCGEIFKSNLNHILQNRGCGVCHGKQVGLSNCLATKNPELAKEWDSQKNGNLTPYDVPANSRTKVYWKCPICNYSWKVKIATRNSSGSGCPICNESRGEQEIRRILNILNIFYIPQKEFEGLLGVGNGNLSYDFYLPDYNLLIEYQGEQHEKYIPYFHQSYDDFLKQVEHDRRKKEHTQNNNINLLEIWYWDFNNIEEILKNELNLNDIKLAI